MPTSARSNFDPLLKASFQSPLHYEFWPALEADSKKLLIILHGRGDSLEGFHFLPGALGIDALNILFLNAPDNWGTGFSWYALAPQQGPGILRSRKILSSLLDDLQKQLNLKSRDIFLFGFSQGCLLCLDVGLRYPHPLGAIIGLSGYLYFEDEYPKAFSRCAREQHFFISHGFQDEMLSYENTQKSIENLKAMGISIDWTPLQKGHTIDEVEEIPLIRDFIQHILNTN